MLALESLILSHKKRAPLGLEALLLLEDFLSADKILPLPIFFVTYLA